MINLRYGPSLEEHDQVVDAMIRIDSRASVMQEWHAHSKRVSDATAFLNENLPYHVAESRSFVGH